MKFDFFKKKETETLDVPKNLPELAKDVIEPASADSALVQKKDSSVEESAPQKKPDDYKIPSVPASSGVPRLDLNLIRSENIHLPDMPSPVQSEQQEQQELFIQSPTIIKREPVNIITLPRATLSETNARNIYINKGKALFDDLESTIASNKTDLAKNIINNILPLLYEYHDIDSMNDSDRLRELKDLEKFWTMLQKRNYAVKSMIDSIESDILRKSNGLMSSDDSSTKIVANQMSSASASSSSNVSSNTFPSSGYQPVFVPMVRNPSNSSSNSPSNSPSNSSSNSSSNSLNSSNFVNPINPIYVQPHERFYFKDGKIASSLKDLYYAINDISDDTFYHHVSIERNDFSNWIKDVLKDYSLAKEISTIYSRRELLEFLKDKI